jgi:hypothetical protein
MLLDGWIGLKRKARERHVFTLPATNSHFAVNHERKLSLARLRSSAQIGVWNGFGENMTQIDIKSL